MITSVVAVDPGPTTGIAFLDYHWVEATELHAGHWHPAPESVLLQAEGKSAVKVLSAILRGRHADPAFSETVTGRFASVERFVTGRGAGSKGGNADTTRQLVMELTECLQLYGYSVQLRSAADVKPWATDKRLVRAGIADAASGIHGKARDAYDAARHALYCATWDAKMKDPLA